MSCPDCPEIPSLTLRHTRDSVLPGRPSIPRDRVSTASDKRWGEKAWVRGYFSPIRSLNSTFYEWDGTSVLVRPPPKGHHLIPFYLFETFFLLVLYASIGQRLELQLLLVL